MEPIQVQLTKKQKPFSVFLSALLKFKQNFEHFEKKDDCIGLCISDITDCERRA